MKENHDKEIKFSKSLLEHLETSTSPYHVIKNNAEILKYNGFKELKENEIWKLEHGKSYFVTRDKSSICAFKIPKKKKINGFNIVTTHSDHPCFRITANPNNNIDDKYTVISTEPCPNPLFYSYVDVPLSIAGKLSVNTKNGVKTVIVDANKPILLIPSLPAHMQRDVNTKGAVFDPNTHMRPLFSLDKKSNIVEYIAKLNNINYSDIISTDLFVYRASKPYIWGENNEFLSSRGLDDQLCVYCALYAITESKPKNSIAMHLVFNSEEVGSSTRPGANSTFINYVFARIQESLQITGQEYANMMSNSFALSADNAHAFHPNYGDLYNQQVKSYLGEGPAIKFSARKSYCTTSSGYAICEHLAKRAKTKIQRYYNKPGDTPGSTLSKFFAPNTSILTADIGIPQLAMHSGFETCSTYDAYHLKELSKELYSSNITMVDNEEYSIE